MGVQSKVLSGSKNSHSLLYLAKKLRSDIDHIIAQRHPVNITYMNVSGKLSKKQIIIPENIDTGFETQKYIIFIRRFLKNDKKLADFKDTFIINIDSKYTKILIKKLAVMNDILFLKEFADIKRGLN
jgi:hypothetical protein